MTTVGTFEAETHFPQLLDRVSKGERIVITDGGKPVAMLVPPDTEAGPDVPDIVRQMRELRKGHILGDGRPFREIAHEGHRY